MGQGKSLRRNFKSTSNWKKWKFNVLKLWHNALAERDFYALNVCIRKEKKDINNLVCFLKHLKKDK